ncbi:MAG TPA: YdeI/OmpD-associated family protein [Thermoanaerobaculia bacterium]|nr:YdeI/OmpD-associated family protein [Thermoanaerobaculia bacterium]
MKRPAVANRAAAKARPTGAKAAGELPIVSFASPEAWSAWLAAHAASSPGVWLRIAKKASGGPSVTYDEALDVALAWGWIDGQKNTHDGGSWLQKFTPRRARSMWSQRNRAKALALIAAGKMQPAGLAEVERARHDGRWDAAYGGRGSMMVPDDLAAALAATPRAAAFFATLDPANRFAVLFRIQDAKLAKTRAARIARFVAMLASHETIHPARRSS